MVSHGEIICRKKMSVEMDYNEGRIELIVGPMFSGKSTELFRRVHKHILAGKNVTVVKWAGDNRYDDSRAATHDGRKLKAVIADNLSSVKYNDFDIIAIDEGQFFPDLKQFSIKMANQGKIIIIAALDATFEVKPFGDTCELIPHAESVVKLHGVCALCGKRASFTRRIVSNTEEKLIGGLESYIATCRKCFYSEDVEPYRLQNYKRNVSTLQDILGIK